VDAESPTRIDEAVDDLFLAHVEGRTALREGFEPDFIIEADHNFKGGTAYGVGEVRVKVTMDLVEVIGLANESDNKRKIRTALEELLFAAYSSIVERGRPDPWPKTGRWMTQQMWQPLERNTKEYLKSVGIIGGKTTPFRQDEFLTPEGENVPPKSMWNSDGMMEGKKRSPGPPRCLDDKGPEDWEG
jgi:hypothetical protein